MPARFHPNPSLETARPAAAHAETSVARRRSEQGQALVEFALVLPLVIVILLGVVLFGVALNNWIDETQLSSEAARFAAVNSEHGTGELFSEASFLKWVTAQGDNGEVQKAKATMCSPTSKTGDYVEVKLVANYTWFGLAGLFGVKAETPLTSTARMRIEKEPPTPYPAAC